MRACPAAAFHADDDRGNLPLHLLLANGECKVTLAEIQSLWGCTRRRRAKAARGWTCLHAFCRRPPQQQDLRVLRLLLRGVAGRKRADAGRVRGPAAALAGVRVHGPARGPGRGPQRRPRHPGRVGRRPGEAALPAGLAHPPAWRIKGSRELTACDAAPADLQGVLMGAATTKGPSSLTDVSRAIARAKPRRRKAGAGLPLVKLIEIGADDALQKRLRVEKHRDPEPIPIDLLGNTIPVLPFATPAWGCDVLRAVADAGGAGAAR